MDFLYRQDLGALGLGDTRGGLVGRTLVVAAALTALTRTAAAQQPTPAPPPANAADLYKQGQDAVARGDAMSANSAFSRALDLEPSNFDYKLALADSERQLGWCDKAIPRYKELLDGSKTDADRGRVTASAKQCPQALVIEPPPPPPPQPPPPAPPPKVIEKEGPPNMMTVALLAGAGVCLGVSASLFLSANQSEDDADAARSFEDYESIQHRADMQKIAGIAFLGGAIGLGAWGLYRIKYGKREDTQVTMTPTQDGGAVMVRGAF
jgi:tetratricopeptide (TPR) repeat protein